MWWLYFFVTATPHFNQPCQGKREILRSVQPSAFWACQRNHSSILLISGGRVAFYQRKKMPRYELNWVLDVPTVPFKEDGKSCASLTAINNNHSMNKLLWSDSLISTLSIKICNLLSHPWQQKNPKSTEKYCHITPPHQIQDTAVSTLQLKLKMN